MYIYNSLTRKKEKFIPITPNEVKLYVCGMTVYDDCHIGHARVLVVFDLLQRYFKFLGYKVNYIRNITDIDDKIIKQSALNGEEYTSLTKRIIKSMHEDTNSLFVESPSKEPKATEYIAEMIELIENLIKGRYAYEANNGDVYYKTLSFPSYGKLANQNLESLQLGERIEVNENKEHPLDFVLWKAAKEGEPYWQSPWGKGRPGWHIECSAMSKATLGDRFDIHGGGMDLKFPHHECEIAQSEPVCGGKHVNYWMHNGFVQINKEKMSKSLNNFFTIKDVLSKYSGEVLRFFILSTHYRSPLNYSNEGLDVSSSSLFRLYNSLSKVDYKNLEKKDFISLKDKYPDFFNAMDDDLNTAKAISHLFQLAKDINKNKDIDLASDLLALGNMLGFLHSNPDEFLKSRGIKKDNKIDEGKINNLILERNNARADKDFKRADEIRDELTSMGIEIEDNSLETTWKIKV